MNRPLVSAIVSTYNSEIFIKGKIQDLLNQTIADRLEIIIINSGSQQNEDELIKEYLSDPRIRYIKTDNRESIYKAWNRGIKIAAGEFITNANTDDRLKKDALEILVNTLNRFPKVGLVYADQYISPVPNQTFEELIRTSNLKPYKFPDYEYFKQLDRCLISSQSMWRSGLHFFDNVWFDEKYEVCGDYDFSMKVSQKYPLLHLKKYLGVFYLSPTKENKSFKESAKGTGEIQEIAAPFIENFIYSLNTSGIEGIQEIFTRVISIPIPLYYLLKRIRLFISPGLIETEYFHSIEFIYYFSVISLLKENRTEEAVKFARKFLKYGESERISQKLKEISTVRNTNKHIHI